MVLKIKGASQLLQTCTAIHNGDEDSAKQTLRNICQVLGIEEEEGEDDDDDNGDDHPSTTQLLIQLAQENASLFFKDQYDIAYVKAQVADHSEIIALESTKFEYYISKLYYDNTQGQVANRVTK